MRPTVSFILPEQGGDVLDLCAEAMASPSPPLQAGALNEISRVRQNLLHDLVPVSRFNAASIMELLESLPPLEGFPLHGFLSRIIETDFSWEAIWQALGHTEGVGSEPSLFEQVNEWGYVSVPAALNGKELPDPLQLDFQKSGRGTTETVGSIIAMLKQLENPEERRLIIQACCRVLELRVHFDFRGKKE
jgi:hypothetical protein